MLKKIAIFLFFITVSFATLCCDGTISNSTGKGTCSYHGGVCESSSCQKPVTIHFVTASDGEYQDRIEIHWTKVLDATYYKIYIRPSSSSRYRLIASNYQESSYTYYTTDTNIQEFKIVACNSCGCSDGASDTGYIHNPTPSYFCSKFKVIDGDTLEYEGIRYRLYGIDAPESYEGKKMGYDANRCGVSEEDIKDAGYLAKMFLTNLLQNSTQKCTIESKYKDSYKREVALIYLEDGISLNETLIANGYAVAWDKYIQEDSLRAYWNSIEQEAAIYKKGLWQKYCKLMNCLTKKHYSCNMTNSSFNPVINIEQKVINQNSGTYSITGYFAPYHFADDPKSNWTFTSTISGTTYQLLGDRSQENIKKMGVFGWKRVDIKPNPPLFYMVRFEDDPFGWLIFSIDKSGNCQNIYKLAGQDPKTKAFSYDIDGDGKRDSLKELRCKVDKNKVKFFWETVQNSVSQKHYSTN